MLGNRPLALDGQAKSLEHRFDVFFAEARGVVFHKQPIQRGCQLNTLDAVPTVYVGDSGGVVIRQRPNEIVFELNLSHRKFGVIANSASWQCSNLRISFTL